MNPQPSSRSAAASSGGPGLLLVATGIAVVSDAVLYPFYPRLFAQVYGVNDPRHVGAYLAATCLTVVVAFPVWAHLSRRVDTLTLLPLSQAAAGSLGVLCFLCDRLESFWLLSLSMILFKAGYLLTYPYLMRLVGREQHVRTIGLLSVIVHLGGIGGAALGGLVLHYLKPQHAFLWMAAGDFIQMGVCIAVKGRASAPPTQGQASQAAPQSRLLRGPRLLKLGAVMLLFYFSTCLTQPFFVPYWSQRSSDDGALLAGLVYAIPAAMCLLCLWWGRRADAGASLWRSWGWLLAISGLLLQASSEVVSILVGRCLYGWALFHATVRLDLLLFEASTPGDYASDFSRIHAFQQLGALGAFYGAGTLVAQGGLRLPFVVAAAGLLATAVVYGRYSAQGAAVQEVTVS